MIRVPMNRIVKFFGEDCTVQVSEYSNGRTALQLLCSVGPMATATVNLPNEKLGKDCVFIKNYSENEGMLEALVKAGVVRDTGKRVRTGYVEVPMCELLI